LFLTISSKFCKASCNLKMQMESSLSPVQHMLQTFAHFAVAPLPSLILGVNVAFCIPTAPSSSPPRGGLHCHPLPPSPATQPPPFPAGLLHPQPRRWRLGPRRGDKAPAVARSGGEGGHHPPQPPPSLAASTLVLLLHGGGGSSAGHDDAELRQRRGSLRTRTAS
jgi:hypothetical protein